MTNAHVHEVRGNLLNSSAPALAHGVNTDGIMGAGVARLLRDRHPQMFLSYRRACRTGTLSPGGVHAWQTPERRWIYNVASQQHPGPHARLDWLQTGLKEAAHHARQQGIDRIALPRIGCGLGGLRWVDALPVLQTVTRESHVALEVWTP